MATKKTTEPAVKRERSKAQYMIQESKGEQDGAGVETFVRVAGGFKDTGEALRHIREHKLEGTFNIVAVTKTVTAAAVQTTKIKIS